MRLAVSLLTVLLAGLAAPVSAQVRLAVVDVDPGFSATLGHWDHFSLRIEYATDRAIRIRGDAYLGDERVTSINGGSPRYDAGTGEALFWFAYTSPASVDRIVVRAVDDETGEVLAQTERPVRLEWTGRAGTRRARPAWVERLQAEQSRRIGGQMRAAADREESAGERLFFDALMWGAPVYLVLQLVALWMMRGGWRIAAAVPAVPMGIVVAYTILALLAGSNLFPLVLIFASPPAALYLILLLIAYRFAPAR